MVKKAIIAVVIVVAVAIVAVGAYVALSGDNDNDQNKVTFLIQDDKGAYFWINGSGETALDALEDAFSDYPSGTLVTGAYGINSIFGNSSAQDTAGNWIWWIQFTWKDDKWSCNGVGLDSIYSKDVKYMLILFGAGNMTDPTLTQAPEGTPTPDDAKVWDCSTRGTVFQIESESGLYFKINGTGGDNLLVTLKNACEKYNIPMRSARLTYDATDYLSGIFGIYSVDEDDDGNWVYWAEYGYKSGAWEPSTTTMAGLKSSDNPKYALVFGDGTGTPT